MGWNFENKLHVEYKTELGFIGSFLNEDKCKGLSNIMKLLGASAGCECFLRLRKVWCAIWNFKEKN